MDARGNSSGFHSSPRMRTIGQIAGRLGAEINPDIRKQSANKTMSSTHHFDPEAIWRHLEETHHKMLAAMEESRIADAMLERAEASSYEIARKDKSMSVEDAKKSARINPLVIQKEDDAIKKEIEYQKAKGKYEHAKILSELRRTEQASLRAMRV